MNLGSLMRTLYEVRVERIEITQHDVTVWFEENEEPYPFTSLAETSIVRQVLEQYGAKDVYK